MPHALSLKPRRGVQRRLWCGLTSAVMGLAPAAAGCGAGADGLRLSTSEPTRLMDLSTWLGRLAPLTAGEVTPVAVGSRDREVVARRLDPSAGDRPTWRHAALVTQPAIAAGHVVVFGEGSRFAALDASSGEPLWSIPAGGAALVAVTDDGNLTALTLFQPRQNLRSLLVLDRGGRELLELQAEAELGVPAFSRGTLIVPWGAFVTAIDVNSATEIGRVRVDTPFQHATWLRGDLFFGGPPWVELGVAPSPPYVLPRRPLPGRVRSGPGRVIGHDRDVTRLYVDPTPREPHEPDVYLATYGRVALGIDARLGALQWVLTLPGRALAAAALPGAFAVCDDTGVLRWLDASSARQQRQVMLGAPQRRSRAEPPLKACSLSAGSTRSGRPSAGGAGESEPAEPLIEQLARVLSIADPELSDVQRFLSRELAARPEPEATRVLIDLATRSSADPILQADAEDLLATRRNGRELMLQALAASGLAGNPAALPPLGPLADALGALGESRAAPLLAEQLNHPGHSAQALARAAAALERLASGAEYANLSVFFSLHRTTADQPELVEAVNAVGRTLLRIGGDRARALVQLAVRDPLTVAGVREQMTRELGGGPQSAAPPMGRYGAVR